LGNKVDLSKVNGGGRWVKVGGVDRVVISGGISRGLKAVGRGG